MVLELEVLEVLEDTDQVLEVPVDMVLELEVAQEVDLEVQLEELVLTSTSALEVVLGDTDQELEEQVVPGDTDQELEEPVAPEDSCLTVFPSHQAELTLLSFLLVEALLFLDLLSDLIPTTLQLFL